MIEREIVWNKPYLDDILIYLFFSFYLANKKKCVYVICVCGNKNQLNKCSINYIIIALWFQFRAICAVVDNENKIIATHGLKLI